MMTKLTSAIAMFFALLFLNIQPVLSQDPGESDTLYFEAVGPHIDLGDTTLVFVPEGSGPWDVKINVMVWTDNGVAGIIVPLTDSCYDPVTMPTYLDSMKNQYFDGVETHYLWAEGSVIENFDAINLNLYGVSPTLTPPNFLLGAVSFDDSFYQPSLLARLVFTVQDTGCLCLDTIPVFYPGFATFGFVTLDPPELYKPVFKPRCFRIAFDLVADFSGDPQSGFVPLEVQFTDSSSGNPTSWHWDFGDGDTDSVQNPMHTYNDRGHYDVKLVISNEADTDSIIKYNYIHAFPYIPDPGEPDTVYFEASSPHSGDTLWVLEGSGPWDVEINVMAWTDNGVIGLIVPLTDLCYDPITMPTYLDSMKNQYFDGVETYYLWAEGSLIENFDIINLNLYGVSPTPTPPNFFVGGVDFIDTDSFYYPGRLAHLVFTVQDTGCLCLDTIPVFHPGVVSFLFVTPTPHVNYKPVFKPRCFQIIPFICGDVNNDKGIDLSDVIYLANYKLKSGPPPPDPICRANANGDDAINLSDVIYLANYKLKGGPAPHDCENYVP